MDQLAFVSFLLPFICVLFEVPQTVGDTMSKVAELKKDLDKITLTNKDLKNANEKLAEEIDLASSSCNQTLSKLKNAKMGIFFKVLEKNTTVKELLNKIEKETLKREQLEIELTAVYADLNQYGVTYENTYQKLVLLENRRKIADDLHCESTFKKSKDLKTVETESNTGISGRSISNIKEKLLNNKLSIAKLTNFELKSNYNALKSKKKNDEQLCISSQSDLKQEVALMGEVLESFKDNVIFLRADLQASIALTKSLNVELKSGKQLLGKIKQSIHKFNQTKKYFEKDELCYATIKKSVRL